MLGLDVLFAEAEETSAERLLSVLAASGIAADPEVAAELAKHRATLDSNSRFADSFIARDVVTGFVFKDSLGENEPAATGVLPAPVITANAIAPGPFPSKMMAHTLETMGEQIRQGVPLKRIGEPGDMAGAAIYLASKAGSYVSGVVIPVDGGIVASSRTL